MMKCEMKKLETKCIYYDPDLFKTFLIKKRLEGNAATNWKWLPLEVGITDGFHFFLLVYVFADFIMSMNYFDNAW